LPQSNKNSSDNSILATPAIRHLLKTHNIDISQITGTGKDQRILREDVLKYI
jgi:2-oxoisovalerate dehydrogenase E2 component (dihydrolipoyl transacylase)